MPNKNENQIFRLKMNFKPELKDDGSVHFAALVVNKYDYDGAHNGKFEITEEVLKQVLKNINNKAIGTEFITAYEIKGMTPDGNPHDGDNNIVLAYFKDGYIHTNDQSKKELVIKLLPKDKETKARLLSGDLQVGSPDLLTHNKKTTTGEDTGWTMTGFALFQDNLSYQEDLTFAYKLKGKGNNDNYNYVYLKPKTEVSKMPGIEMTPAEVVSLQMKAEKFEASEVQLKKANADNLELSKNVSKIEAENIKLKAANDEMIKAKEVEEAKLKLKSAKEFVEINKAKMFPKELILAQSSIDKGEPINFEAGIWATIPERADSLMLKEQVKNADGKDGLNFADEQLKLAKEEDKGLFEIS